MLQSHHILWLLCWEMPLFRIVSVVCVGHPECTVFTTMWSLVSWTDSPAKQKYHPLVKWFRRAVSTSTQRPCFEWLEPVILKVQFWLHQFFRPSATSCRIGLMESCTCHCHCCGGPRPSGWPPWLATPPKLHIMTQAALWSHVWVVVI